MNKISAILFVSAVAFARAGVAQPQSPVVITATGQHYGGQVVYTYEVTNRSDTHLRRLILGLVMPTDVDGRALLTVLPRLRNPKSFSISPDVATRPSGWGVLAVFPEGSAEFAIEWIEANYFRQL